MVAAHRDSTADNISCLLRLPDCLICLQTQKNKIYLLRLSTCVIHSGDIHHLCTGHCKAVSTSIINQSTEARNFNLFAGCQLNVLRLEDEA